jgi:ABC-2 type transport system permease protein
MNQGLKLKAFSLLQREAQEYRNSFLLAPLAVAGLLVFFMLASTLFANRIAFFGDSIMQVLVDEHSRGGMNITITIDESDAGQQDFVITDEELDEQVDDENWNFSREWTFNPQRKEKMSKELSEDIESLNPVLNIMHGLFLALMFLVSINYLLGSLHTDRRDRSVLFWKSMPVSEWQEVGAKMATVTFIVPGIYIAVSILTQLAYVVLAMLLVWRMDLNPAAVVLNNINFVTLFSGQLGGWLVWVLWTAPLYAWLLLSSAAARRSPLMFALAIPIGLAIVTEVFLGTELFSNAIGNHIPHWVDGDSSSLGFYLYGPEWLSLDYLGMLFGLVAAAAMLAGAVWFRKHRFEL